MSRARIDSVDPSVVRASMSARKAPATPQRSAAEGRNARINSPSTSVLPLIPSPRIDTSNATSSALPIVSPRAACIRAHVVPDTPSTPLGRNRLENSSVSPSKISYATPKRPQDSSRSESLNRPRFVVSKPKHGFGSSDGSVSSTHSRTRPSPTTNNLGLGSSVEPVRPAAPRNASITKSPAGASRLMRDSSHVSRSSGSSRPEVDRESPASAERKKTTEEALADDAMPGSPSSATSDYWGVPADLPNILFTPAPPPRMTAADVHDCDNGSIASYDPSVLTMQTFVTPSILDRASAAASAARTRYTVTAEAESKAARVLQTAAQSLKSSSDAAGRESPPRAASMSSGVLLDACDGTAPLTGALLAEIVRRPRATTELLARPPFRFIYAVAWAAHRNTGLGQGDPLFSTSPDASMSQSLPSVQQSQSGTVVGSGRDDAPDPRKMDKNERVQWLNSLAALLDSYLRLQGKFASAINGKQVVSGYDTVSARRLLQLIAVAASANPTGVGRELHTSRNFGSSSHDKSSNRVSGIKSPSNPDCLELSPPSPSKLMTPIGDPVQVAGREFAADAARRANANAALAAKQENEQRQELVALARTKRREAAEFAAAAAKAAEAGAAMAWEAKEERLKGEALAAAAAANAAKEEARLQAAVVEARTAAAEAAAEAANRVASARRRGDEEARAATAAAASAAEAASLAEAAAAAAAEEARILAAAEAAEKAAQDDAMRRAIKMAKADANVPLQEADDAVSAEGNGTATSSPNQPTVSPVGSLGPTSSRRNNGDGSSGDSGAAPEAASESSKLNVTADFVTPKHGGQLPSDTPLAGVTSAFTEMLRETEQARAESKLLLEGLEKERLERSQADAARESARQEMERMATAAATTAAANARAAALDQQQQHLAMIAQLEEQVRALREERKAFEAEQALAKERHRQNEGLGVRDAQQSTIQSTHDAAAKAKEVERKQRRQEKEAAALERSQRRAERREREALAEAELELRVRLAEAEARQREDAISQKAAKEEEKARKEAIMLAEQAAKQEEERLAEAAAEAAAEAERVASIAAAAAQFLEADDEEEWERTPRLAPEGNLEHHQPTPEIDGSDLEKEPQDKKEKKQVNDTVSSSIPKKKPPSPVPKLDLERATKLSSPPKVPPSPYAKASSPSSEVQALLEKTSSRVDGTTSNDSGSDDSSSSDSDSSVSARPGVTSAMNSPSQENEAKTAAAAAAAAKREEEEEASLRPPTMSPELYEHLRALFAGHDVNGSGALDWEAFWWCIKGLGLGLSDDEIHAAHKRAGHTAAGEVMWADFVPVAGALLQKSTHPFGDYSRHANNPWARMFDRDSSSHYYFNRKTQACEWVDGTVAQYERVKGYAIQSEPLFKPSQQHLNKSTAKGSSGETSSDAIAEENEMGRHGGVAAEAFNQLPLDQLWEEHMDQTTGASYFVNPATGETSWERPERPDADMNQSAGPWQQPQEYSTANGSPFRQPFSSTGSSGNSPLGRSRSVSAHEWSHRFEERPSTSLNRALTAAPGDWQQHQQQPRMYDGPPPSSSQSPSPYGPPNGAYYPPHQQQQPIYGWQQPPPQQPVHGSLHPYGSHSPSPDFAAGPPAQYVPPEWTQQQEQQEQQEQQDWGQAPLEHAQPPRTQPPLWSSQQTFDLARSHTATPDLWHPSSNPQPPREEHQHHSEMVHHPRELTRAYTAAPNEMWGGPPEDWAAYHQQQQPPMQSNWSEESNLWEQPNNEDHNASYWQQTEAGDEEAARTEPSMSGAQDEEVAYEVTDPENLFQDLQSRTQDEDARHNNNVQTAAPNTTHASSMRSLSPPRFLEAAALDYGTAENGPRGEQGPSGMSPPRAIPRAAPQAVGRFDQVVEDGSAEQGGGYYDEYGAWVDTGGVVNSSLQAEGTWDWDESQWNSYHHTEATAQTADY